MLPQISVGSAWPRDARATARYAAELAAIAAGYFVLAKLGLALASLHPSASPIWPPTGFALAVVLLRGYRVWPAIFLGALRRQCDDRRLGRDRPPRSQPATRSKR